MIASGGHGAVFFNNPIPWNLGSFMGMFKRRPHQIFRLRIIVILYHYLKNPAR